MMLNKVSLNTIGLNRIGLNRIGKPSRASSERPYIDPEVLASLKAVCICYGKSNDDPDRAVVKNLVDPDNPFVISNAAYEGMSGYNGYPVVFGANKTWEQMPTGTFTWNIDDNKLHITKALIAGNGLLFSYVKLNGSLLNVKEIPSFKIKVSGLEGKSKLWYRYLKTEDAISETTAVLENGTHELPKSYIPSDSLHDGVWIGFTVSPISEGVKEFDCDITIEVLPEYEGAFVTDGINDLITSTKSATEMLDGSNEVTVVSMIHQIKTNDDTTRNNWFFTPVSYLENRVVKDKIGKTGIYGYTSTNVTNAQISDITPILGDKNDYTLYSKIEDGDRDYFTVEGFQNQGIWYVSSIAWYWTIIANKVLTTDEINQVIAYYNLDRTLNPDILCNTIKQGITNENHAEFGDKLIDFSGNGRDIQLNNIAWKGDSGIGKYETDFTTWTRSHFTDEVNFTPSKIEVTGILTTNSILINNKPTPIYNVEIHSPNKSIVVYYQYNDDTGVKRIALVDGINELPSANDSLFVTSDRLNSKGITITQIPSHAGALCLDGVNDFGKVTGMPIYKDYTVIVNKDRIRADTSCILSKASTGVNVGAFITEFSTATYSFGLQNAFQTQRVGISYQSKYVYNGERELTAGSNVDTDTMWLGTIRDNDSRFFNGAIYSLMSFPYSMSEFLIERQLKKHKLGTLYPDMVEFRPIIKGGSIFKYLNVTTNEEIFAGDYIHVGDTIRFYVSGISGTANEVSSFTVNGVEGIPKGNNGDLFDAVVTKSPQKINITIDEYIRYEDIVQPYPVLLRFNDENGNEVSWGGKFKVGSTITRIGSIDDTENNLLNGLYSTNGLTLNGKAVTSSTSIVEKQMVFKTTATYLLDNNEPNCILSPRLLRIPNSSYKILGHIPDISGHRNHGKINNSAYAGMSGANGYTEQTFSNWRYNTAEKKAEFTISNDVKLNIAKVIMARGAILYTLIGDYTTTNSIQRYKVTGVDENHPIVFGNDAPFDALLTVTTDGEYEVDWKTYGKNPCIFTTWTGDCNITIEQIGEYEGAYCLDGVDDFVTIPTATGGKQVFMKVNSRKSDCYLYDQRNNWTQYLGIVSTKDFIAYNYSNQRGKTYIDGILNENITANDLISITHNITVTNNRDDVEQYFPCIGTSFAKNSFAQMSLYDFMLFDNISTDDKIKELNEYVGIEAKVELPPYYWDAYGKTNLDEDKATIQQRGVAVGDYDLTNYNHAYDKMSGYGGYSLGRFDKSWASSSSNNTSVIVVSRNPYDITLKKLGGNSDWEFNNTELKVISNPVSVKFKSNKNIRVTCDYHYYPVGGNSEGAPLGITSKDLIANKDAIITISPISQENIDKYNIDVNRGYYLIYFQLSSTLAVNEEVTIEMLPLYPNGLVYDGVDDYSKNENIPVLTDYTIIAKRLWINKDNPLNEQFIHKGAINTPISESAFMLEYEIANDTYYRSSSYGGYINIERSNRPERIVYQTSNSYNGTSITKGSGTDTTGIVIGGVTNNYWNGVFYKLMLYSKTLPLLQINYLKNLMERDEIIDLNNKIFIQE